jgi:hypothetical protein
MIPVETVLDPGPIPYAEIAPYDDPDLEHALREDGFEPDKTRCRLLELPLAAITDTKTMPWPWPVGRSYVKAIEAGHEFPPIVVVPNIHGSEWGLLDGCNRTYAYWTLGKASILAYELLTGHHLAS